MRTKVLVLGIASLPAVIPRHRGPDIPEIGITIDECNQDRPEEVHPSPVEAMSCHVQGGRGMTLGRSGSRNGQVSETETTAVSSPVALEGPPKWVVACSAGRYVLGRVGRG